MSQGIDTQRRSGRALDGDEAAKLRGSGLTVLEYGWPDLLVIDRGNAYGVELKRSGDAWDAKAQVPMADAFANVLKVPYLLARSAEDVLALDTDRIPRDYRPPVVAGRAITALEDPWLLDCRKR